MGFRALGVGVEALCLCGCCWSGAPYLPERHNIERP